MLRGVDHLPKLPKKTSPEGLGEDEGGVDLATTGGEIVERGLLGEGMSTLLLLACIGFGSVTDRRRIHKNSSRVKVEKSGQTVFVASLGEMLYS